MLFYTVDFIYYINIFVYYTCTFFFFTSFLCQKINRSKFIITFITIIDSCERVAKFSAWLVLCYLRLAQNRLNLHLYPTSLSIHVKDLSPAEAASHGGNAIIPPSVEQHGADVLWARNTISVELDGRWSHYSLAQDFTRNAWDVNSLADYRQYETEAPTAVRRGRSHDYTLVCSAIYEMNLGMNVSKFKRLRTYLALVLILRNIDFF